MDYRCDQCRFVASSLTQLAGHKSGHVRRDHTRGVPLRARIPPDLHTKLLRAGPGRVTEQVIAALRAWFSDKPKATAETVTYRGSPLFQANDRAERNEPNG